MTTISAKIIADSVSPEGIRLTTMQLRYPRWIHAEFMTHRQFSRNASSSRAIPVSRLIQDVLDDPAVPMFWGKNQKGMQAGEEIVETPGGFKREVAWRSAMSCSINVARDFDEFGYHKQIVNRLLEPFSHINVLVTATEWSNFFALRRHKDAEPHIHHLADRMWEAMEDSRPTVLEVGHWHLPYVKDGDRDIWDYALKNDLDLTTTAIHCSVARCARLSYLTYEGKKPDVAADVALYDRLVGAEPLHASPAEHQAQPDIYNPKACEWYHRHEQGNFRGWRQLRKMLPNECISSYSP